jgi:hypothetical protein
MESVHRRITGEDMGSCGPQKLKAEASVGPFLERGISARHGGESATNLGKSKNLRDLKRISQRVESSYRSLQATSEQFRDT